MLAWLRRVQEFGRVLSSQIEAWKDVSLVELTPAAAVLQVRVTCMKVCGLVTQQVRSNPQKHDGATGAYGI